MNEDYERGYDRGVLDTIEEVQRLTYNWNELKKWLESESSNSIYATGHLTAICMVLNKMQELEEGGNNENN